MANGEQCKKCGFQETAHDYGEAFIYQSQLCDGFESEINHLESCPIIDCLGDCETTILDERKRQEKEWSKIQH